MSASLPSEPGSGGGTSPTTDGHLMALILLTVGGILIAWAHLGGELIPVREGTGYDGSVYAGVTRNPSGWLLEDRIGAHRFQRIAPSLLVHAILRPFGLQTETPAVILGFHTLNFGLMVIGCYVWRSIVQKLCLSRVALWVGFAALFLNYGMLKFASYYPVLTDVSGFFLGLMLLWSLVHGRYGLMPWIGLLGAFTWPTVFYSALLLYSLSNPTDPPALNRRRGLCAASALTVLAPLSAALIYRCGNDCVAPVMMGTTMEPLLPISLLILAAWVFLATRPLLDRLDPRQLVASINLRRLAIAAALFVAVAVVVSLVADPTEQTVARTLRNVSLGGAVKPGGFVVAHAIYFGPAVVLAALLWRRRITPAISRYGPSMLLLMLVYVLLATDVESRKFMNLWPFFAAFAAYAAHELSWGRIQAAGFVVLSILLSRVWFPLNQGELTGNHQLYPDQFYFMSMGPRMTVWSYLLMLGATAVIVLVVWLLIRPRNAV